MSDKDVQLLDITSMNAAGELVPGTQSRVPSLPPLSMCCRDIQCAAVVHVLGNIESLVHRGLHPRPNRKQALLEDSIPMFAGMDPVSGLTISHLLSITLLSWNFCDQATDLCDWHVCVCVVGGGL
jgi:hypothetical protein